MGCNPSREVFANPPATAEQNHRLIREVWTIVCNECYEEVGISFMVRIFQVHPELRKLWIFAANLDKEHEIRSNSQARYHAAKIVYTLNEIISNIEDNEKRRKLLEGLGKVHFMYEVKPTDFQAAVSCMEYVLTTLLGKRFTARHKQAWSFLFQQIVVDLGRGVENQANIDATMRQNQHNFHNRFS